MLGSIVIFVITYIFIATEKVDKTVAALLGAAAAIIFHLVPYEHALHSVDLNVIFLLVGMMIVMHILSQTGVFEWMAVTIAQRAKGNGIVILLEFVVITAFLSAILDNVTTVILIAPITILICEILEIPAVPFLILEAVASNIGGTSTLVGDPPNVIIGSQTALTFNDFIYHLAPVVVIMMIVLVPAIGILFRSRMKVREQARTRIMRARPSVAILDPPGLRRALIVFALILVAFFASHAIGVEPGIIALAGALIMLVVCKTNLHHALEKVEWNSVFFFIGLFMLIGALEYNHVFQNLGEWMIGVTDGNFLLTVLMILWFAAIMSAIVDNIPLVIAMIPLIEIIVPDFGIQMGIEDDPHALRIMVEEPLYWALALGACLGGNGTLVGASANVVITQMARRNNYPITFLGFTRYGAPVMFVTVAISSVYLYVRYFVMLGR